MVRGATSFCDTGTRLKAHLVLPVAAFWPREAVELASRLVLPSTGSRRWTEPGTRGQDPSYDILAISAISVVCALLYYFTPFFATLD